MTISTTLGGTITATDHVIHLRDASGLTTFPTVLLIDTELLLAKAIRPDNGEIEVARGALGSAKTAHTAGATVASWPAVAAEAGGLPTGWTQDVADPANVASNQGGLDLGLPGGTATPAPTVLTNAYIRTGGGPIQTGGGDIETGGGDIVSEGGGLTLGAGGLSQVGGLFAVSAASAVTLVAANEGGMSVTASVTAISSPDGGSITLEGYNSTASRIRVTDDGKAGFFNATAVVKPTGVAVTAEGIHAALVSLGLIAGP